MLQTGGTGICSRRFCERNVRQEEFLGFYRQYYVETMNHEHIIVRTDRNIKVEAGKEVQFRVK